MTTNFKIVQTPAVTLLGSITAIATTAVITPYPVDLEGNKLTMADFGTVGFCTMDPKVSGFEEINSFTNIIDNGDGTGTLTGLIRDLISKFPYFTTGTGKPHGASSVVVFSDNPQIYQQYAAKANDETILGQWAVPTPTSPSSIANKAYADQLAFNGAGPASTLAFGLVKMSAAPGTVLATPTITIAAPGVVTSAAHGLIAGDMVVFGTSGTLPTGITAGITYYVVPTVTTNTFEIASTSGGTAITTTGSQSGVHTLTKVSPTAISDTDTRLPLQGENDAMAGGGNFGTPSSSNKYLTQQFLTTGMTRFGGTGADGALNVVSGTTTIDLGNAAVFIKNYSSINISAGATVNFINPNTNGTVIILKSSGAVTIAGTLDASGMGGQGGAAPAPSTGTVGNSGNLGTGLLEATAIYGTGGQANGGGTAGAGFTFPIKSMYLKSQIQALRKSVYLYCGSGGGSGCSSSGGAGGTGGKGGNGGAALLIECGGALIFTGTINVSGTSGSAGTGLGSGGGGGSVGSLGLLANIITTNSGTVTSQGGNGGNNPANGGSPTFPAFGGGGAGSFSGAGGSPGANGSTGAGGGGATQTSSGASGGSGGGNEGEYIGLNTELF